MKPLSEFKVYVCGRLTDEATLYLKNVSRMIKTASMLRRAGFSVYVPCLDLLEGIVGGDLNYDDYFNNSQPWLLSAHAIFLTPGWEGSTGTRKEMQTGLDNGIPNFDDLYKLIDFAKMCGYE